MLPPPEEIQRLVESWVPGVVLSQEVGTLVAEPKDLLSVCRALRDREPLLLDYLSNLTAVDYPPDRLEMVYHLYSMTKKPGPLALKVKLPRASPVVASVTPIWRSAEFQEREVYDLFGVTFEGHPDLRRILMWDGFDGHPMRKDYVVEDQDTP
jgi:NADH/F420H2 dehydrogenase subunit C